MKHTKEKCEAGRGLERKVVQRKKEEMSCRWGVLFAFGETMPL